VVSITIKRGGKDEPLNDAPGLIEGQPTAHQKKKRGGGQSSSLSDAVIKRKWGETKGRKREETVPMYPREREGRGDISRSFSRRGLI